METFLLALAVILLVLAALLFWRSRQLMSEVQSMKDDISQLKNVGNLLSVTESTLDETNRTISAARRIMDKRIRRMEELVRAMEESAGNHRRKGTSSEGLTGTTSSDRISSQVTSQAGSSAPESENIDPDTAEREYIARRNRQVILMLEEGISMEEISRRTQASMREIKLIKKFIQ